MSKAPNDVVITGVGIVTCQGVGNEAHLALLTADSAPAVIVVGYETVGHRHEAAALERATG